MNTNILRVLQTIILPVLITGCSSALSSTNTVNSPDGNLKISVYNNKNGEPVYTVSGNGKVLISDSPLGLKFKDNNSTSITQCNIDVLNERQIRDTWNPVWGKRATVEDHFNEKTFTIKSHAVDGLENLVIAVRVYNDGVAFRYEIPADNNKLEREVVDCTTYNFTGDFTAWSYNGEDHNIGPEKLTDSNGERLPVVTIKADNNHYMALHEAYLQEGEPLRLTSRKGEKSYSTISSPGKLHAGYTSSWRVIMYGTTPGTLVDSHLIELLNPAPDSAYDFSWVKPGVALWDWRMNGAEIDGFKYEMSYQSWERAVDFAARQGFAHLVLDANWYGPEFEAESDPVKGDKANDVRRLIDYAKSKGVGIWLYLNDVGGKRYPIEETLRQYSEWGATGVKYGFMTGTHEEKNKWTQTVTRLCAENHLLVDYHDDPVHPYGQMRTWPNAVTREYCHAQLDGYHVFIPRTFCTSVYVNMLAGPLDMNNGMFDLRQGKTTRVDCNLPVPSTVTSEAARTLITFSGVTILPDIPEYYEKYPELLRFISAQKMPWVDSKTLAGEIGEYIVMMRRTEDAWLIGAVTNEMARSVEIPLSFLPEGKFKAQITRDGDDAHYYLNRESCRTDEMYVDSSTRLSLDFAAGGGACVMITKE